MPGRVTDQRRALPLQSMVTMARWRSKRASPGLNDGTCFKPDGDNFGQLEFS